MATGRPSPATNLRQETKIEKCRCQGCGAEFDGEVTYYHHCSPPRVVTARECASCRDKREQDEEQEWREDVEAARGEQREAWRRRCGMPQELLMKTFENFESERQRRVFKVCLEYAEKFDLDNARGYPSLILYSRVPGVGKTHLMAAIVNHIIDHWHGEPRIGGLRPPILFESGPGLVRRIRATYSRRLEDYEHEREEDVYRELRGVSLLLLDDVGKERPSDFTRELYWYLVDERVKSGLPVVLSSRLPMKELEGLVGEDTVDRLYGMARGELYTLQGMSYRRSHGVA